MFNNAAGDGFVRTLCTTSIRKDLFVSSNLLDSTQQFILIAKVLHRAGNEASFICITCAKAFVNH